MCGTGVRKNPSTPIRPRASAARPAAARLRLSLMPWRPAEYITVSAGIFLPLASVAIAPSGRACTEATVSPNLNVTARSRRWYLSASTTSTSQNSSIRSRCSTTVTLVPSAANMDAYSIPITPAPATTIDRGTCSRCTIPSESITVRSSNCTLAGRAGRVPVAITILSAVARPRADDQHVEVVHTIQCDDRGPRFEARPGGRRRSGRVSSRCGETADRAGQERGPRDVAQDFGGRIGRDWRDSVPWWPAEPAPPPGSPNVLLVVLDDVGYAQLGCYGSDIETPVIDGLAAGGVRLANFHTTSLCSPTRACLLTGRNHHRCGVGRVAELAVGYPGYWGRPPREAGFLSEVLRAAGYATYAVGKWHLTPEDETNMAASRATWPLARGFDRWYGFHGGETHQFVPALYHDNHSVRPPASMQDGYHLTEDLADHAVRFVADLRAVEPGKPFFLYLATGACHSPHQPPPRWRERYRGRFDLGWDAWREQTFRRQLAAGLLPPSAVLSPRPAWVPAWDRLDEAERAVAARFMECFAGFLSHADEQIGRVLEFLRDTGDLDNTIVVVVSDNGASAEGGAQGSINDIRLVNLDPAPTGEMAARLAEIGGPLTHNNYPWGWAMAGNTPFRRWKREVHQGGVADPCIVSWPAGSLDRGGIRSQFAHAIDVAPTLVELAGLRYPDRIDGIAQAPVDGVSFAYLLGAGGARAAGRHRTQYFEMFGSRALYHDGWKAVTFHPVGPLYDDQDPNAPFDADAWELYHVAEDPSESRDLAAARPDLLRRLVELWWAEAE